MNRFTTIFTFFMVAMLTGTISSIYGQYATVDEAISYINDRLSHSVVQRVEPAGLVTINGPGEKFKFRIQDVGFNYNGGNGDDRVRVFGDNTIEVYEHKSLKEKVNRQSFLCETEADANEVIAAFRFIKNKISAAAGNQGAASQKLKNPNVAAGYSTVSEAFDYINACFSYSMIMSVSNNGTVVINSPDDNYRIDLARSEFGYNHSSDEPKVRVYGDFSITMNPGQKNEKQISRQSFQAASRTKAYDAIQALYYLKAHYQNLDISRVPGMKNLSKTKVNSYANVADALDFINNRLSYSIILAAESNGQISINAPDDIYRFNIHDVDIQRTDRTYERYDWFPFISDGTFAPGLRIKCKDCIRQFSSPNKYETLDEQVFQCGSSSEAREVVKAFQYIRSFTKK